MMEPLPRVDGTGMYARALIAAMRELGLSDADARAWTRIMAGASRGTCWPRSADLICEREHASRVMPPALAGFMNAGPEGYTMTRAGHEWMVGVRTRLRQGSGGQAQGQAGCQAEGQAQDGRKETEA